ncbi:hypothetical protein LTR49_027888, partial [Elasticomyces elasticus]
MASPHQRLQNAGDPSEAIYGMLPAMVASVLQCEIDSLDTNKSFQALGGDSLGAVELFAKCRTRGIHVDIADILTASSLSALFEAAGEHGLRDVVGRGSAIQAPTRDGLTSESPGHATALSSTEYVLLELHGHVTTIDFQTALRSLTDHHEVLASRFALTPEGNWKAYPTARTQPRFAFEEHFALDQLQCRHATDRVRVSLNLSHGPVFGAIMFSDKERKQTVALVAQSFVVDPLSWHILIEDLEDLIAGTQPVSSNEFFLSNWVALEPPTSGCLPPLPRSAAKDSERLQGHPPAPPYVLTDEEPEEATVVLDESATQQLLTGICHRALRTHTADVVHAALLLTATDIDPDRSHPVILNSVFDGRPGTEESERAVGCFRKYAQISFELRANDSDVDLVRRAKDTMRKSGSLPNWLLDDAPAEAARSGRHHQVHTNQLCISVDCTELQLDAQRSSQVFRRLPVYRTNDRPISARAPQVTSWVQVTGGFLDNRACFVFRASDSVRSTTATAHVAHLFQVNIQRFLSTLSTAPKTATLSDFPLLDMSHSALDQMMNSIASSTGRLYEDVQDISPCSTMQENFLVSQELDPTAYQCRFALSITPTEVGKAFDFTTERLEEAWAKVVALHPALRTTFVESPGRSGGFDQIIWKRVEPRVTLSADGPPVRISNSKIGRETFQVPHHLVLTPVSPREIHFTLDISHAIIDGQSTQILLQDLCKAYCGEIDEDEAPNFTDFVQFEQEASDNGAAIYWTEYLAHAQVTNLPLQLDYAKPVDLQVISKTLELPAGRVKAFREEFNVTTANLCQVAWALVLRRYTSSDDVCFLLASSGRQIPLPSCERRVGPFVNTLPCRLAVSELTSVSDVLAAARQDFVQSLPYQHAAFSRGNGMSSASPRQLGNTMLSFHRPLARDEHSRYGLAFEVTERMTPTDFDYALNVALGDDRFSFQMSFWAPRVEHDGANNILELYKEAILFVLDGVGKNY